MSRVTGFRVSTFGRGAAAALLGLCLLLVAKDAAAQRTVRVKQDHTTIWRPGFRQVADVVKAGTVLDVRRRDGRWFEVTLPTPDRFGSTGMVPVTQVEAVDPSEPPAPTAPVRPTGPPPGSNAARALAAGTPFGASGLAFRAFGQVGYGRFAASQSFDAVIGSPGGIWFGGGLQMVAGPGFFLDGSVEYFRKTGERVFVSNGEVFKLGVDNEITITPLVVTAGYRYPGRRWAPYAGAGAGRYIYKEDSPVADAGERIKVRPTSYHFIGGVEWRGQRSLGTAVEVAYTRVPDALDGGVAALYNEKDLGNVQVRLRLLFGR